jgi:hypothetical protein
MATTTPNFGWSVPTSTDLVKDGATAIETLGDSIDASLVDLKGGTTGQVLAKNSNTDMDFTWAAVDPLVILDAKGDLITATAADTPARLAVGTNGQVLIADSTASTGLAWGTPTNLISTTNLSGASTTVTFPSGYKNLLFVFSEMTNNTADGALTCYFNAATTNNSGVYTTGSTSTSYNDTTVRLSANQTINRANNVNCIGLQLVNHHNVFQAFQVFGGWYQGSRINVNGGGQVHTNILTSMTVANSGGTFSAGYVSMYGTK